MPAERNKICGVTIRKNRAKLQLMSPDQTRELYVKLNEKGYRVTVKYDEITYSEARQILDFLRGKDIPKPDILVTEKEYMMHKKVSYGSKIHNSSEKADEKDIAENNKIKNYRFDKTIKELELEDANYLYQYRILKNELASIGYTEKDFEAIGSEIEEFALLYNELKSKISDLSWEYRNLCKLEYSSMLAEDSRYTNGPRSEYENNTIDNDLASEVEPDNYRDEETENTDTRKKQRNRHSISLDDIF